jgi:hypothetical protein
MKKSTLYYIFLSVIFAMVFQIPNSHGQTFSASSEGINSGNEVCIDVSVSDFSNIIGMQWSMNYDNSLLTYSNVTNLSALSLSVGNFGNINDLGAVTFSWVQTNLQGQTLTDGEIIFSVCFTANSAVTATTDFTFSGSPTAIEIIDANNQLLDGNFNNGSIAISSMGGDLQLASASVYPDFCNTNNGSIDVFVSGGTAPYAFQWSGVNSFASTNEDISGLSSGNYILEVEDADGGTLTATFLIEAQDLELTTSGSNEIGCEDATTTIDLTTNGINPTFLWDNGATTEDIQVSEPGTYSVTVTDGDCTTTENFEVVAATGLAASTYNCTYFNPDLTEVEISALLWCGGTAPHTFTWSDGSVETTDQNVSTITVTNPSGLYSVTISDNFGFEYILDNIEVDCNFPPVVTGTVTDVSCIDQTEGSIDIEVTGGSQNYTYTWSNGETTQDLSEIPSGSYSVTVTDAVSGESTTEEFFVAGSLNLAYSSECQFPISTTISVAAWTGVGPVTYEWSNGFTETLDNPDGINTSSITVPMESDPISFTVTATDATGCTETIVTEADCTNGNPTDLFLSISPEQSNIQQGESTCVDVVVGNFEDILSMQFSMDWDASLVNFNEVTNFNLPGLNASSFGEPNNQLTVSWYDPDLSGESLPDNTPIFTLCYTALNTAGTATVEITGLPTSIEIFNNNNEELSLQSSNGIINIGGVPGSGGTVYGTTATSAQGETACVEIRAIDISGLSGMQFSMNWNPDALNFLGVENYIFEDQTQTGLSFSPFDEAAEDGALRFLFFSDDFVSGESFLDDTPLFELCFEVLSLSGIEPVDITNTPIEIEFIDINNSPMNVSTSGGEIIIIEPLWPGDTDNNGIVNQYDLLNLGLAYGASGPARTLSTDWTPFYLEDWGESTPTSTVDFKHIDTDGNGQINSLDTVAIAHNWGSLTDFWNEEEEVGFQEPVPQNNLTLNAPFYIQSDTVAVEETVSLNIILGEESNPVIDVYGLAFTITFDPEVVVPGSVHANFENSWFGTPNQDMITIYKEDYEVGKLHVAITRIDGQDVSGYDKLGEMNITIKDVIFRAPLEEVIFGIEGVKMINVSEQEIQVEPVPTVSYIDTTTDTYAPDLANKVKVFPSPASDKIYLSATELEIISFEIYTPNGELIKKIEHESEISVKELPSGIYLLKIFSNEGLILKRISKI